MDGCLSAKSSSITDQPSLRSHAEMTLQSLPLVRRRIVTMRHILPGSLAALLVVGLFVGRWRSLIAEETARQGKMIDGHTFSDALDLRA